MSVTRFRRASPTRALAVAALTIASAAGGAHAAIDTYYRGSFGPVLSWPLIAIHAVLLPDGRVMTYGSVRWDAAAVPLAGSQTS